jgi:RNA polymerase sigma factor (sigma-70 family)
MNAAAATGALHQLRALLAPSPGDRDAPDGDLLRRFAAQRDEGAFAELLRRHGGLVLGVCHRVLGHAHAAEDAFQATFLLLAQRAARLRRPGSLAGWLQAVAQRIASQARRAELRRRERERRHVPPSCPPADDLAWREVRQLLDAELTRLPEKYRTPLVLCYLEGLAHAEVARRLGCSDTVLRGRLERGREALRRRLARLGLPLAAPLLLLEANAPVAAALRVATLATVRAATSGNSVAPAVASLVAGTSWLSAAKWKLGAAFTLVLVVLSLGAAAVLGPADSPPPPPPAAAAGEVPKGRLDVLGDPLPPGALMRLGTQRHRYLYHVYRRAKNAREQRLPDGKTVLTTDDREVRWVDMATGRLRDVWPLPEGYVVCGFSQDGRLAVLGNGQTLSLWDLMARRELRRLQAKGQPTAKVRAYFSPQTKTVAAEIDAYGSQRRLRVWDVASGRQRWEQRAPGEEAWLSVIGFLPDGETLVVLDTNRRIILRDSATGQVRRSFAVVARGQIATFGLSPDGKTVLCGSTGAAVQAWDVASGQELEPLGGHTPHALQFAFAPDSKTVLTAGSDPFVLVWDWPAGKLRRQIQFEPGSRVQHLGVSADGRRAEGVIWGEHALRFFDLDTGKEQRPPLEAQRGIVYSVAVPPTARSCPPRRTTRSVFGTWARAATCARSGQTTPSGHRRSPSAPMAGWWRRRISTRDPSVSMTLTMAAWCGRLTPPSSGSLRSPSRRKAGSWRPSEVVSRVTPSTTSSSCGTPTRVVKCAVGRKRKALGSPSVRMADSWPAWRNTGHNCATRPRGESCEP